MNRPHVSILLPVFNGARHLHTAIESILGQTFSDWELLVIDDGSSDTSVEVVQAFSDSRIVLLAKERNEGLSAALNSGIHLARGSLIARMDADDISLPDRLSRQVSFMQNHPEVGVCGTQIMHFGEIRGVYRKPTSHDEILAMMLVEPVMRHPSVMIRRSILDKHHFRYDSSYEVAQDYDLWTRMIQVTRFANLSKVLLKYRCEGQNNSKVKRGLCDQLTLRLRQRHVEAVLGRKATETQAKLHHSFADGTVTATHSLAEAGEWIKTLQAGNKRTRFCKSAQLDRLLAYLWCMNAAGKQFAWRLLKPLRRPDYCALAVRGHLPQIISGITNSIR